ncbi:MAG: NHL repeat-containing protein [Candidatus Zixiibacteriota bacterium]
MSSLSLVFVLVGCGGKARPGRELTQSPGIPTEIVLERMISGQILGRPLSNPTDLAIDNRGALYLLDSGNKRVIWFNRDLAAVRDFSGEGSSIGKLGDPRGLAVDSERRVWVTDRESRLLVQCSDQLEYTMEIPFRDEADEFVYGRPAAIAVTEFGDIWVVDPDNHRVVTLDAAGQFDMFVGDAGSPGGQLREPSALALDRHDRIYVCDRGNHRVMVYDVRGGLVQEVKYQSVNAPTAVAIDPSGRVWVLEEDSSKLHCLSNNGELLAALGPTISGADQPLLDPSDLVFLPDGRLVISDTGRSRLLVCRVTSSTD